MKKSLMFALLMFTMMFGATTLSAQTDYDTEKTNYFVLNRNVQQLKAITLAAGELAAADGEEFGQFQVVVCGNAVKDLANAETMKPIMELANKHNVMIIACGFSLKKFEVSKEDLPENVKVVDNGILHGFNVQKDGFYSITL